MDTKEIEKEMRKILSKNFNVLRIIGKSVEEIKNTDYFIEELGIDSVGIMALVSEIEKTFEIKIEQGELTKENLGNIGSTVKYVSKKNEDKTS